MIVIPMAGLSSRFTRAGYAKPKYMLDLNGGTVFDHAVGSFAACFAATPFVFIARDVMDTEAFVRERASALGIADARVVTLAAATAGQAETVEIGIAAAGLDDQDALTIFNIDTFRPGFALPDSRWLDGAAGYLEVFRGSGANWSYVRPSSTEDEVAVEVREKQPISELCCTGLYHFERVADFRSAVADERRLGTDAELYVAPLYNHLIRKGMRVRYTVIAPEEIVFCGVPDEYEALLAQHRPER